MQVEVACGAILDAVAHIGGGTVVLAISHRRPGQMQIGAPGIVLVAVLPRELETLLELLATAVETAQILHRAKVVERHDPVADIPELLGDVLDGAINPGRVFDYETDLDHIADGYRAMDERRAIKSLVRVGAI